MSIDGNRMGPNTTTRAVIATPREKADVMSDQDKGRIIRFLLGFLIPVGHLFFALNSAGSLSYFLVSIAVTLIVAGMLFATWWAVLFMPPVMVAAFLAYNTLEARGVESDAHMTTATAVTLLTIALMLFASICAVSVSIGVGIVKRFRNGAEPPF